MQQWCAIHTHSFLVAYFCRFLFGFGWEFRNRLIPRSMHCVLAVLKENHIIPFQRNTVPDTHNISLYSINSTERLSVNWPEYKSELWDNRAQWIARLQPITQPIMDHRGRGIQWNRLQRNHQTSQISIHSERMLTFPKDREFKRTVTYIELKTDRWEQRRVWVIRWRVFGRGDWPFGATYCGVQRPRKGEEMQTVRKRRATLREQPTRVQMRYTPAHSHWNVGRSEIDKGGEGKKGQKGDQQSHMWMQTHIGALTP